MLPLFVIGLLVIRSAPTHAAGLPGLVAGYSFDEGSGAFVGDVTGGGSYGTPDGGVTWTAAGKYGSAMSFDGSTGSLDLGNPAAFQFTGSSTWAAWVYATVSPSDDGQIIAKSSGSDGWQFKTSPDTGPHTFAIGVSNGSTLTQRYSTTVRALNTWYHVAGVYNASARTLDIYVNGVLDNGVLSGTVPSSQGVNSVTATVGRRIGGAFFAGTLDEIQVYNRALSAAEVQTVMTTPLGPPPAGSGPPFINETVVQNLNFVPTMRFLPDGRMLVGEIAGTIRIVQSGATSPDATAFNTITGAIAQGDAGLQDLILDPNFATNGFYYVYYAHTVAGGYRDRLSRFTAAPGWNSTVPGSELVLWQDDAASTTDAHHGAGLAFGSDGKLYFSEGDNGSPSDAQALNNFHGKVMRINSDGTIPTDNPFYDGAGPNKDAIWAYGLRNPYRLSFDAVTGNLYEGDVGGNDHATAWEEINIITRGANYGWPLCEGNCSVNGVTSPLYTYAHGGRDSAVMLGFVYRGSQYPAEYQGNLFIADYAQNWLKRLILDSTGRTVQSVLPFEPASGGNDNPAVGDPVMLQPVPTARCTTSTSASTSRTARSTPGRCGGCTTWARATSRPRWSRRRHRPRDRRRWSWPSRARGRAIRTTIRSRTTGTSATAHRTPRTRTRATRIRRAVRTR
ncbi:MAG: PQQ-dependent sugar dehydrogenase [Dehalococcoidia bacterium]